MGKFRKLSRTARFILVG
ncbi:unnamed protein product [Rhodiola kirilowii]